ncbi:transposase [Vibrio cyclitrophicus 1F53]|uniref:helix-turn-helix domain-containing protein n=2 Tax=Vibrio cyclitrophicus TaxID=47951 RepID=UPI0003806E16|nr:helix-turn-helix domain-containing protein [Vibrio cyclitrophicus]OEF61423.1 hypothetical protein OAA_19495 [Vibrio cyclitrophicus 1F175]PMH36356.1 hypothetical protein BCU72_08570 [Vibrio cyclitrophicus]
MKHDFPSLINSTSNARLKIRYLAVSHFVDVKSHLEIAKYLKVSRVSVNKWVKAYLDNGLEGLQERTYSGRPHRLTDEQKSQFKEYVVEHAINKNGGRLQAKEIGLYIESNFDTSYKKSALYQLLHDTALSWITTRSKYSKQSVMSDTFKPSPKKTRPQ